MCVKSQYDQYELCPRYIGGEESVYPHATSYVYECTSCPTTYIGLMLATKMVIDSSIILLESCLQIFNF